MNKNEVIDLYNEHETDRIIVRHKKSKTIYDLSRDVVDCAEDEYVYGYFVEDNPRRKTIHGWFYLENVEFVRPVKT